MNKKVNLAASIRARLLNRAKADNTDFGLVLTRYSLERLLFRLSLSEYRDSFLLKGALLFDLWFDISHRPTRDVDFLGFGSSDLGKITSLFRKLCRIEVPDGIMFQAESVRTLEIRKESNYAGVRVTLLSVLGGLNQEKSVARIFESK